LNKGLEGGGGNKPQGRGGNKKKRRNWVLGELDSIRRMGGRESRGKRRGRSGGGGKQVRTQHGE